MHSLPRRDRSGLAYAACCYAVASVSFAPAVHSNFLPAISREFQLSLPQSSLYLSLNFWGALAAVILAGPIAGRIGTRRVLLAAWLLETAGVLCIGLAPHPMVAYGGVLLASLGFGSINVLVPHLVSGIRAGRGGRAMALLISFYTLGAVASNLLVLLLFSLGAGWRVGYLLTSAMGIPWGFLLLASGYGASPEARAEPGLDGVRAAQPGRDGRRRWGVAVFIALCVAQLAGSGAEVGSSMWVPTFLSRESGAPESIGPLSLLFFCVMGSLGKLANAAAAERVNPRVSVVAGLTLFAGGLVGAALSRSVSMALAGFALAGFGTGGFVPAVTVRLAERFPGASSSRYSLFMAVGTLGPICGPPLVAMVAGGNLRLGMLALLPAAGICAAILFALGRLGSAARQARPVRSSGGP